MTYPPYFYKAFKEEEHAKNFIEKGEMRFGSLSSYKKIEDPTRQDETEGYCQLIVPGIVSPSENNFDSTEDNDEGVSCICMEYGTACFAFCVSDHNVSLSHLRKKGDFIVKINSPEQLEKEIDAFCQFSIADWPNSDAYFPSLREIHYSKNTVFNDKVSDISLLWLSTCQKHDAYSDDCEHRYLLDSCVPVGNCTKDHVMVNLNKRLNFCELVSVRKHNLLNLQSNSAKRGRGGRH